MKQEKLESLVKSAAEILGTVSSTTIGFLLAGHIGAYAGAVSNELITSHLKKLGAEISEQIMGPREKARIGATYITSNEKIKQRLDLGHVLREDDFFDQKSDDRSSADTILEGILQKAKKENEEKKLPYYSSFLCNICFDKSINFNRSITYLKIIDRLSYQQLCIISVIEDMKQIEFENWNSHFINNQDSQIYLDFYFELVELFDLNVLKQFGGKSLLGPKNGELSKIGADLYNLMDLSKISDSDKHNSKNNIYEINKL